MQLERNVSVISGMISKKMYFDHVVFLLGKDVKKIYFPAFFLMESLLLLFLMLGLWPVTSLICLWYTCWLFNCYKHMGPTVLIPVPNGGFFEVFLWTRIFSRDCRSFPRGNTSVNILIPSGVKSGTYGRIDYLSVQYLSCYTRAHCHARALSCHFYII